MSDLDPELTAMSSVATALSPLDEDAKGRVLRWAAERFGVAAPSPAVSHRATTALAATPEDEAEPEDADTVEGAEYGHFAELFDASGAITEPQRLLVAAYWVQKIDGAESFGSQTLNTLLKNLGRPVTHTSERMEQLIKAKPALIWQLRKAGNTKQARKTYKLTHEGVKAVERMIHGS